MHICLLRTLARRSHRSPTHSPPRQSRTSAPPLSPPAHRHAAPTVIRVFKFATSRSLAHSAPFRDGRNNVVSLQKERVTRVHLLHCPSPIITSQTQHGDGCCLTGVVHARHRRIMLHLFSALFNAPSPPTPPTLQHVHSHVGTTGVAGDDNQPFIA